MYCVDVLFDQVPDVTESAPYELEQDITKTETHELH